MKDNKLLKNTSGGGLSRRQFLERTTLTAAGLGAASLFGASPAVAAMADRAEGRERLSAPRDKKLNILFIFTDQERYFRNWPVGFSLPGRERIQKTGTTFHNHYCPATMCTSSRSVLMTGLTTPNNKMFENLDLPWIKSLSTDIPTIGHMLRKAGYYTAYKGKWHLAGGDFDVAEPEKLINKEMEAYGFSDFNGIGDLVGHQLGGYKFDHLIAGSAITWLRNHGQVLSQDGKPWSLTVSLVNPHDVMYFDTDAPGQSVQNTGRQMKNSVRAPNNAFYKKEWDITAPKSLNQSFSEAGRPGAHGEFSRVWDFVLGNVPSEAERWHRLNNFYLNSIRAVDLQVLSILKELDALGLSDNTAIVFTSDHGEMGGAHGGLRGKGPTPYEECTHLPFYIVHPDIRGGQETRAVSGHIDVAPTLLSMAGVKPGQVAELAGRELPGKDLTAVLQRAGSAPTNAVREAALFTYSGLFANDGDFFAQVVKNVAGGKDLTTAFKTSGQPDLKKRGTVRTAADGRYKFTRYFGPTQHNTPKTIDDLYLNNDVELYDLQKDPSEMTNLAAVKGQNKELVMTMNTKLNNVIKAEIGADDGREMPEVKGISWVLKVKDNQAILD
ncbi:MAG TPA: sulfatase-like hydrolase/transferase [Pyrinomonadaceae bacterium]|nr:sulfatase-like hydrolase/transferase [Pyrinomonadaceae bacterium]